MVLLAELVICCNYHRDGVIMWVRVLGPSLSAGINTTQVGRPLIVLAAFGAADSCSGSFPVV